MSIGAPAKLNLSLRVLPPRSDGFHGIESLFQRISLQDELEVKLTGNRGECSIESPFMVLPEVNTLSRAVEQFRLATGTDAGVRILIKKNIPDGSGLGGGSSDAAAVLNALNMLTGAGLSGGVLRELGAAVGSDVPFFLSAACAIVTGRGEEIYPVEGRRDFFLVLVCPEVHSSTAAAYRLVDDWAAEGRAGTVLWSPAADLEKIYREYPGEWSFHNSFTPPLTAAFPIIGEALSDLKDTGALFTAMSGSGSSVFGIYMSVEDARSAQKRLFCKWRRCYFVLPLDF